MVSAHFAEVSFDLMFVFISLVYMVYLPPSTSLCFVGLPSLAVLCCCESFLMCLQSQLFFAALSINVCSVWLQVLSVFLFLLHSIKGRRGVMVNEKQVHFSKQTFQLPNLMNFPPSPFCLPWLKVNVWVPWSLTRPGQAGCTVPFMCVFLSVDCKSCFSIFWKSDPLVHSTTPITKRVALEI